MVKYDLKFAGLMEGGWVLVERISNRRIKRFATKADALSHGGLEQFLGRNGGSVAVHSLEGGFVEERTFPRRSDPSESPG